MGHHHAYSVQRRARALEVAHQSLALPSFRVNSVDSVDQANRLVYAASFRHVDYESARAHMQGGELAQLSQALVLALMSFKGVREVQSFPR